MFQGSCATLYHVFIFLIGESHQKRLKQIGALLAIAVPIGFGLGAMIFAFIDTPFAHKGADGLPLLCDYRTSAHLCHDVGWPRPCRVIMMRTTNRIVRRKQS